MWLIGLAYNAESETGLIFPARKQLINVLSIRHDSKQATGNFLSTRCIVIEDYGSESTLWVVIKTTVARYLCVNIILFMGRII